mmetsp:Transcript_28741/g.39724  ORF Transcript_28741/g.39724 Transcript_28741/m.39724 type:complete len:556 (-) Transcript_28741:269-1936(-)|eukprot:CAMPEP_0196575824 /NCGR_PEP_ID=MMETSP1081-20130531/5217_1 /TAXON_ID=36882 /ORGANISM="Pyramimonas amylifera, Strain CCMP720" /LENGTH=555 /DNA_ID=CAMNT_0041894237 /DNA_START=96 /DNA_END=1763 /DNA_ORIENTATION=-
MHPVTILASTGVGCWIVRNATTKGSLRTRLRKSMFRNRAAHCSSTSTLVSVRENYTELCTKLKEISALEGVEGLLNWDQQVMMPPGAAGCRAQQSATMAGVVHEKSCAPELGRLLALLSLAATEGEGELSLHQKAVIRDASRNYTKTTALTKELAQRQAELTSTGFGAWVKAREENDFYQFAPVLQQWIDLTKEKCALIDPSRPVYDVCLDEFERGMTSRRLDEIFKQVKEGLVPLLREIEASKEGPDNSWLSGTFDLEAQAALCRTIACEIGFDTDRGRLDVSVHPFTGGSHPSDVRMTTRFKEGDLTEGLTGAIHETGHALYEQGRNLEYDGLPVNAHLSMGIHESQSLLWERMVALHPAFSEYLLPQLKSTFPQLPSSASAHDLYSALNVVRKPSLIRVESDEVTYPMHIILRYEIERGLLDGSIPVADLPEVWRAKMKSYLGCSPATDAQGVLQDIHWSAGAFGYFPTYSLGAMYAVQLFNEASNQLLGLEADIAAGNFKSLKIWLNDNVHSVGSLYPSGDLLMEKVTDSPLNPDHFVKYLREKYTPLYKL